MTTTKKTLTEQSHLLRQKVLEMCVMAGKGHVTSSFSCIELMAALYYGGILRYDAARPDWDERDRFILSKGQASPLLYVLLADLGFFSQEELATFCQKKGFCGVHLQHTVPGVEISSGSLGLGLGVAAGIAMAARMDNKSFRTYALLGDGECHEGSTWEAVMFAAHQQLDSLTAIVDRNYYCATGKTEDLVKLGSLEDKWAAYGWEVLSIDGHTFDEILPALEQARRHANGKPLVIIAHTVKGKGIRFMEHDRMWHGLAPTGKDAERAREELEERETG